MENYEPVQKPLNRDGAAFRMGYSVRLQVRAMRARRGKYYKLVNRVTVLKCVLAEFRERCLVQVKGGGE